MVGAAAPPGGWVVMDRHWRQDDRLEVTLPMRLGFSPAPDQQSVQAVTYGPVVLAGAYGTRAATAMSELDTATVTMATRQPLTFHATADGRPVTLLPRSLVACQNSCRAPDLGFYPRRSCSFASSTCS